MDALQISDLRREDNLEISAAPLREVRAALTGKEAHAQLAARYQLILCSLSFFCLCAAVRYLTAFGIYALIALASAYHASILGASILGASILCVIMIHYAKWGVCVYTYHEMHRWENNLVFFANSASACSSTPSSSKRPLLTTSSSSSTGARKRRTIRTSNGAWRASSPASAAKRLHPHLAAGAICSPHVRCFQPAPGQISRLPSFCLLTLQNPSLFFSRSASRESAELYIF